MAEQEQGHLVTVVMPLFDSRIWLPQAVASVQAQDYQAWELIIVDDCSQDASLACALELAGKDTRIRVLQNTVNSGAAHSRNRALDEARGDFVAFLDADDLWHPQKLSRQVAFMLAQGHVLTHTWYHCVDEDGRDLDKKLCPPGELSYRDMLRSNKIGCLTVMFDRRVFPSLRMPPLRKRQDYATWLNILKEGHKAYALGEDLATYRVRKNSLSSNKLEMLKHNWKLFYVDQKLGALRSLYYLMWNVLIKLFK